MAKPPRKSRPRDVNQLAKAIVDESTAEEKCAEPEESAKAKIGRLGGQKGGKARAENLAAEERKTIAQRAAEARWRRDQSP